jgi:hypothetical protein
MLMERHNRIGATVKCQPEVRSAAASQTSRSVGDDAATGFQHSRAPGHGRRTWEAALQGLRGHRLLTSAATANS